MNYFIIDRDSPSEKLRHFRNSRTASFNCAHMNSQVGKNKYEVIASEEMVQVALINRN